MATDIPWDLDFTGTTTRDADLNEGKLPDGWYRAKLEKVTDNQQNGAKELEFRVCHGPLTGCTFTERLQNPGLATETDKAEFAHKKLKCYGSRLGLVDESADGKKVQRAFGTVIGKEVVVRLETTLSKKDNKHYQNVANFGFDFYHVGHPKMPAEAYTATGLPVPAGAPTAAAKPAAGTNATAPAAPPVKTPEELAAMIL